jgi:hypothetical protein
VGRVTITEQLIPQPDSVDVSYTRFITLILFQIFYLEFPESESALEIAISFGYGHQPEVHQSFSLTERNDIAYSIPT